MVQTHHLISFLFFLLVEDDPNSQFWPATPVSSIQDVLGAAGQKSSTHTTFLVKVVVNQQTRKKNSEHHIPLAKAKAVLSNPTDEQYTT